MSVVKLCNAVIAAMQQQSQPTTHSFISHATLGWPLHSWLFSVYSLSISPVQLIVISGWSSRLYALLDVLQLLGNPAGSHLLRARRPWTPSLIHCRFYQSHCRTAMVNIVSTADAMRAIRQLLVYQPVIVSMDTRCDSCDGR